MDKTKASPLQNAVFYAISTGLMSGTASDVGHDPRSNPGSSLPLVRGLKEKNYNLGFKMMD